MYVYIQFVKGKYKETYIRKTTDLKCLAQGSGVAYDYPILCLLLLLYSIYVKRSVNN
jgi:hypothetical protein